MSKNRPTQPRVPTALIQRCLELFRGHKLAEAVRDAFRAGYSRGFAAGETRERRQEKSQ